MTQVTLPTYQATSQANIAAFLSAFFDGNSHAVGINTYTFPQCLIKFGRKQLTRSLPIPWIVVEYSNASSKDVVRSGSQRQHIIRDGHWRFIVITQVQDKDNAPDWKTNDKIADLLQMILNTCRPTLAAGGQRIISVGPATKVPDPAACFQVVPVVIRCDLVQGNGP